MDYLISSCIKLSELTVVSTSQNGQEHHVDKSRYGGGEYQLEGWEHHVGWMGWLEQGLWMNCDGTKREPCTFHGDQMKIVVEHQCCSHSARANPPGGSGGKRTDAVSLVLSAIGTSLLPW